MGDPYFRRRTPLAAGIRSLVLAALCLATVYGQDETPGDVARLHLDDKSDAADQNDPLPDSESAQTAESSLLFPASFFQPQPFVQPATELAPAIARPMTFSGADQPASLFEDGAVTRSMLSIQRQARAATPAADVVFRAESKIRVTTDAGSVLGKSPSVLGVGTQKRTPIVTDPRVRGNRVGRLAAAGSYWVPARLDLDTMVSKIDSRIVHDMIVINGPYSVLYGPGFEFVDIELLRSPRYGETFELHGSTSADYQSNGEQFYGRQEIWGGDDVWGFRIGYGHRTGNDYEAGNGTPIPSSYKSRDWDVALGCQLTETSSIEFSYLRLDQTDVEFPGQAFDIDFLVTDGYEVEYLVVDQPYYDQLEVDAWYNRTRFMGSAQREGKRRQFPLYDFFNFVGFTDVDSMSTGFRTAVSWGDAELSQLTAGVDLRYLKQELNEISSGRFGLAIWDNANSPIPESYSGNPGVFAQYVHSFESPTRVTAGVRGDWVDTNVTDDPAKLAALGLETPQHSLAQILGTGNFDQSFQLWSAFLTADHDLSDTWTLQGGFGYAERPPSLTELYAAQSFMFLLQNGLNTVTGDPTLPAERLYQLDIGFMYDDGVVRGGVKGFHAWVHDYITFENLRVFVGPPAGQVEQVNLQFVNTDLATLQGGEAFAECNLLRWLTPFATVQYVEGTDHTRNGDHATQRATGGIASVKVAGLPRGFFSGVAGGAEEPLPGILPLQSRVGIRIHEPVDQPGWLIEFSGRIVDNQDRVAASLLESPTPGFTVWDVRGKWQAKEGVLLIAGAENLGDRTFREHLDFRAPNGIQMFQPGANFYVGTELVY